MHEQIELSFEARSRLLTVDEIYALKDASWLKLISEDRRVERKTVGIQGRGLADWFSMWANTAPHGGIIAIGISDTGEIDGILNTSVSHINDLERTGDIFCPDSKYEFKRAPVTNEDGKPDQLILIRVHYNQKKVVRTTDGSAFVRRGDSKRRLTEDEIRELQVEKGEVSLEQENSALNYPGDFDSKAIADYVESVIAKTQLEHSKRIEDVLSVRRLGKLSDGQFIPNKACALLFAKDPCREIPGCKIRFLRFDGKEEGTGERFNAVKDEWIEGTIPSLIVTAEKIIESQLREFSKLGRDGKFSTSPEYPKLAWYEAVVNACCHRSFNLKNIPVFVRMFDDRLEVESPGGFLPFVTPKNIYDCHHPRNPDLMNALYFLDFVKCAHEGTRRMRQTMTDLELPPPDFSEKHTSHIFFKVVLRNNVEHRKVWLDSDASRVVGEVMFRTLSEYQKRVINYVAEYGRINVSDTMRLTRMNWHSSRKLLLGLVARRILKDMRRPNLIRDTKGHFILEIGGGDEST